MSANNFADKIPIQAATDPIHQTPVAVNVVAGGVGGGPVTIANGADTCEGFTTDAGITTDVSGSISAKLRGVIIILLRAFQLGTPLRIDPVGTTPQPVTGSLTLSPPSSTNYTTSVISVGSTATLILAANSNRLRVRMKQMGVADVFLGHTNGVTATSYIDSLPMGSSAYNGASVAIIDDLWKGAIYGVVSAGSCNVSVTEYTA